MKHLREICSLFSEVNERRVGPTKKRHLFQHFYSNNVSRMMGPQNRLTVIDNLEKKHEITRVVTDNLCRYMDKIRKLRDGKSNE